MPAPLPADPLDGLITYFVNAVNDFLYIALDEEIEPPEEPAPTGNPFADIQRGWGESKRRLGKFHEVLVGAEPVVDERLQAIIETGSDVVEMTEDPFIVGPVEELVRLAEEHRVTLGSIITRIGIAKSSFLKVLALWGELVGITPQVTARLQEMLIQRDALTSYYLMQMPPKDPA